MINRWFITAAARVWLFAAAAAFAATTAHAQPTSVERFERQAQQIQRETLRQQAEGLTLEDRVLADYGGYVTFGYYSIDDALNRNHVLRQYELLGYLRLNLDEAQEIFLRARTGYRDFNDGDSFDGRGDEAIDGDLDRGYYRVDLARLNKAKGQRDLNLILEGGRDLAYWANGLTLAQVMDGLFVTVTWGGLQLDLIAGVTPTRTVDFDSSRPAFDYNTHRGFYGAMLSARWGAHRPYVYYIAQRDYNDHDFLRVGTINTRYNYNSDYLGFGSTGALSDRLLYGVEVTLEGGWGLSNSFALTPIPNPVPGAEDVRIPTQTEQKQDAIRAMAADVRLDYLLQDPRRTRLSAEFIYASGDTDRFQTSNTLGGNRRGSDDHAFNAFGSLNTGLAFAPAVSNLIAVRAGASTFPFVTGDPWSRLQIGTDLFVFAKARSDAPIDEPTDDRHYLGFEPDFFMNWQITNDVTIAVRYGVFFPGAAIPDNDARQFLFLGVTYAF
jgi:hypothetical protein